MTDALLQRVIEIVAATFNVAEADVSSTSSPETLEAWDSMGQLMLILALEQDFDIQIPPEAVERTEDVASLVTIVRGLTAAG